MTVTIASSYIEIIDGIIKTSIIFPLKEITLDGDHVHITGGDGEDYKLLYSDSAYGTAALLYAAIQAVANASPVSLPITEANVTGLVADLAALSASIAAKLASPINEADVTGLVADLAAKLTTASLNSALNNLGGCRLIAFKQGISGSVLATVGLDYITGLSANNSFPSFAIIIYNAGVIGICAIQLVSDSNVISDAAIPIITLVSGTRLYIPVIKLAPIVNSGVLGVRITTASSATSKFDCYMYGICLT